MAELEFNIARLQQCLDVTVGTPAVGDVLTVSSTSPLEFDFGPNGGGTGTVDTITGNDPIDVDNSDPANPAINIKVADKAQSGVINDAPQEIWGVKTFDSLPVSFQDPVDSEQLATKKYVDTFAAGLQVKAAVRAATTVAGTLASSFQNGSIIDTVTLVTGDRILIKNQTNAVENGIYTVNVSGAPTRSDDYDAAGEANAGTFTTVTEGGQNNTQWVQVNTGTPDPGTDALNFSRLNISGNVNTIQSPNTAHGTGGTLTGAVTLDSTDIYYSGYSGNTIKQEMVTVGSIGGNPQIITGNKKFNGSVDLTGSNAIAANQNLGTNTQQLATCNFVQAALANSITGGASTIRTANLTINRALISNALGKVAVSTTTSAEISYLNGVTSGIQNQLNGKLSTATAAATYAPLLSPAFSGTPTAPLVTPSTDSSTKIANTEFVQNAIAAIGSTNFIKVSLSASQIKSANSTPVTVISAPGVGKFIDIIDCSFRFNYIAPAYANSQNFVLYNPSTNVPLVSFGYLSWAYSNISKASQSISPTSETYASNEDVKFILLGVSDLLAGNSTLDMYITYRIITL